VAPEVDLVAEKIKKEADMVKDALLGYAKFDILSTDLRFGRYNARPLNSAEVTTMLKSMKLGMERYRPQYMISVVVEGKDVDPQSLTDKQGDGADALPEVRWADGQLPAVVMTCSGQHRRAALEMWKKELEGEVKAAAQRMATLEAGVEKRKVSREELEGGQRKLEKVKQQLKGLGYWGVAFYDISE
jgi:hypothetical protein